MFDLLVSPFFDSQGGQIKVRFGGTLRVRPTVHSQIWIALTATLLLELVRRRSAHSWSYKTLAWVIRQNLWGYQNLNEILSREKMCEETKVTTTLAQLTLDL